MTFDVIASGSRGNAVLLNNEILIDCGVSFKKILKFKDKIKLVLLSHIHSDHFNSRTIRALAYERPSVRIGCGRWMVPALLQAGIPYKIIDVFEENIFFTYSDFLKIKIEKTFHNVENCAFHIFLNGEKIFYATDTKNLLGISAENYDLYFVEANYNEDEIRKRIFDKITNSEFCYEFSAINNHMSREEAERWVLENCSKKSEVVFLHQHQSKYR